jgi:predicted DNA-binding protein YlxM (UPF0122 family)
MIEKDFIALYEAGLTIKEISEKSSLSYETIRKILKNNKVKWRRNYISDFSPEQIQDIIQKFDNKISIKEIAKLYNISQPAISRLLKANNREAVPVKRKYDILRQTPINAIQKQIVVGSLLGNGCLYRDSNKANYKLSFSHCKKQEQYFHWKIAMMDPFINTFRESIDKRGNSVMLQTTTICHQDFNKFGDMFYDEKRIKHVPKNLDIYLTPLALAVWIQDDGNLKCGVNMRLATMSFTEIENYMLRDYLKSCFDLNSKVMGFKYKEKQYWQITFNKGNTQKLSNIIRPYVTECMKYKIMPESSTTNMPNSK